VIQVKALFARFALEPEPPVSRNASGDRVVADRIAQAGQIGSATTADVANWPFEQRLKVTLEMALPKLGPEVRAQLLALITPEAIAIMAGVLVAWIVSHLFAIGEIFDIILLVAGVAAIGYSIFTGMDHLYLFATGTYNARSLPDLDAAAGHFAKAVGILGIQAVLAVLFRGRPYGRREPAGPPPPTTPGFRYTPTLTWTKKLPAGMGETSFYGDILVSSKGSAINSRLVALYHEQVHRWFAPKLYLMRNFRADCATGSYVNSSLWRYITEMLAEGISQGRVYGFRRFFVGFGFPVKNGYLYLLREGADPRYFEVGELAGRGFIPELAGLLVSGVVIDMPFQLRHSQSAPSPPRQ